MLELRPCCERCGDTLRVDDPEVYNCSFECAWCATCAAGFPGRACPNCGGNLTPRPIRPGSATYAEAIRRAVTAFSSDDATHRHHRK